MPTLMTPRHFLDRVVRPNLDEFGDNNLDSLRHAFNAVGAIDALAAHMHHWLAGNCPSHYGGDDTAYRQTLAAGNDAFSMIRDIAKAQKHVSLTRGAPLVRNASEIATRGGSWGGSWGESWGRSWGQMSVQVRDTSGQQISVHRICQDALHFLEAEMADNGM